ncbi:peptide chain release factor N(5)-glutamine methyltransferase [Ignavibacteriales bacterium]
MPTVLEILDKSTKFLDEKGIESPRLNADLLMAHVLSCKRLDLYMMFDRPLKEPELESYRECIRRRIKYEPLQYIVGNVEFFGLKLEVDSSVLIPRQETELLVDIIIQENKDRSGLKILDIGTGSGNIAISLAKMLPEAEVTSIDVSEASIETAKKNATLNSANNITFKVSDVIDFFNYQDGNDSGQFDLIISNPPYVSNSDYLKVQEEILKYEPSIAVTDFADGYKFHSEIISNSLTNLKQNGKVYLEMALGQDETLSEMMVSAGYSCIEVFRDHNKIKRFIRGIKA